ncbi:MAG: hypothetical protein QE272_12180 [Nevskia sp.]|nr:hypothetical protein [Nevskia sp.]
MFIDNPTIPTRLEVLLDVLHLMHGRKADKETVDTLLQPEGLPGLRERSNQANQHISAAEQLELIAKDSGGNLRLNYKVRGKHDARGRIIAAFEAMVLTKTNVERWAARMYAFLLQLPPSRDFLVKSANFENLTKHFMDELPAEIERLNPMNDTKLPKYLDWYAYVGLGWFGPHAEFVVDPTIRLERALPAIFGKDHLLDASEFMTRLAEQCPELDGGHLFREIGTAWYAQGDRRCTRGLASALRNLHDEAVIGLRCPRDNKGWDLSLAGHVNEPGVLDSDRFDQIELRKLGS